MDLAKEAHRETVLSASADILEVFGRLGNSVNVCVDDLPVFSRYILNLYFKNKVLPGILTFGESSHPHRGGVCF